MRAFVVDAFARAAFGGNPTGIVLCDRPAGAAWMQAVAAELNLPATAFVDSMESEPGSRSLRWFSPTTELALCGSGTLAAAHIVGGNPVFQAAGTVLKCAVGPDGAVSMWFPADPVQSAPSSADLVAGLRGITVGPVWRGRLDVVVEAASAAEVRALQPDTAALAKADARAVIVTAVGDGDADIVSRVFAPRFGIPEDPVTGSAHCAFGSTAVASC